MFPFFVQLKSEGLGPFLCTGNINKYEVEAFKGGNDPLSLLEVDLM